MQKHKPYDPAITLNRDEAVKSRRLFVSCQREERGLAIRTSSPFVPRIMARNRSGLVLLVVLGMLALFTLLAVSYLTFTSHSRDASLVMVRSKLQRPSLDHLADNVIRQVIRGNENNASGLYGHSLLEDIYGRATISGEFVQGSLVVSNHSITNRPTGIVKIQIGSQATGSRIVTTKDGFRNPSTTSPENGFDSHLSIEDDTYTGRLITFTSGPLANQTYRILAYRGNIGSPPNYEYSIAIDLSETDLPAIRLPKTTGSGADFDEYALNTILLASNSAPYTLANRLISGPTGDYEYVINDIPFNGFGYGVERDPSHPNYGNLDQSRWVPGTKFNGTSFASYDNGYESFPIALLPNYDYLSSSNDGSLGHWKNSPRVTTAPQITDSTGSSASFTEVVGSSNEGIDVPDARDYWLGYQRETAVTNAATGARQARTQSDIIPSYHRPELVNYIANYFRTLDSSTPLTSFQIVRIVTLIDYACARPLAYRLQNCPAPYPREISKNVNFTGRDDAKAIPILELDFNTSVTLSSLRDWIAALSGGTSSSGGVYAWDVDNDGDGTADSNWIDPSLPFIRSFEGRMLKPLAANLIMDLDGRLNVNLVGDVFQAAADPVLNYATLAQQGADQRFSRSIVNGAPRPAFLPQGVGYGPADISLNPFRFLNGTNPLLTLSGLNGLSSLRLGTDNVPGIQGQDWYGRYVRDRDLHFSAMQTQASSQQQYGLTQSRRGRVAIFPDLSGNPRMSDHTAAIADDVTEDLYEIAGSRFARGDNTFAVDELEALLRRNDQDASSLPDRLRSLISSNADLSHVIYESFTTRSAEIRNPPQAALGRHRRVSTTASNYPMANGTTAARVAADINGERLIANSGVDASLLRWVQMLYHERFPGAAYLEMSDIRELFPLEFRKGLRLDINRPFGNGRDDNNNGDIDEPEELASLPQEERAIDLGRTNESVLATTGEYAFGYPSAGNSASQAGRSRRLLARQLYCLAQLLVPLDYPFGGAPNSSDPNYIEFRGRELAQWAINVVDFRDSDGAMTRFEYDVLPFTTESGDSSVWQPKAGRVVWGMEFPELVLTETLAFHDKRCKDTDREDIVTNPPPPGRKASRIMDTDPDADKTLDQYRIPQGSLFIELVCTRSPGGPVNGAGTDPNLGKAPSGLYATNGSLWLSRRAASRAGGQPVWRIGIAKHGASSNGAPLAPGDSSPLSVLRAKDTERTFSTTHQGSTVAMSGTGSVADNSSGLVGNVKWLRTGIPTASNEFDADGPLVFDRMVWFTGDNTSSTTPPYPGLANESDSNAEHRIFYNKRDNPSGPLPELYLSGGQYFVIGPRSETLIGSRPDTSVPPLNKPSYQHIALQPNSVDVGDMFTLGNRVRPAAPPALSMVAVAEPPIDRPEWGTGFSGKPILERNKGVGLNVSEPLSSASQYYPIPTADINPAQTTLGGFPNYDMFQYWDGYADMTATSKSLPDVPFDDDDSTGARYVGNNLKVENKNKPGTYPEHRIAYLQRLADPDVDYDPVFNPYITIDWMPIDLTVFNGEDVQHPVSVANVDPEDVSNSNPNNRFAFASRFKDGAAPNDAPVRFGAGPLTPTRQNVENAATGVVETGVSLFSASTGELEASTGVGDLQSSTTPPPLPYAYFTHVLGNSNQGDVLFNNTLASPPTPVPGNSAVSLGYLNTGRSVGPNQWDGFGEPFGPNGEPRTTQAGLFWMNRPFANPYELMLVPKTAPGNFSSYIAPTKLVDANLPNKYGYSSIPEAMHGYLPAFFASEILEATSARAAVSGTSPTHTYWMQRDQPSAGTHTVANGSNFALLLELIETKPPYANSDRYTDINAFNNAMDPVQINMLRGYLPPHHVVSRYVDYGKVNINTIAHEDTWNAIEWNFDNTNRNQLVSAYDKNNLTNNSRWGKLLVVRQGYTPFVPAIGNNFLDDKANAYLHPNVPSQFRGAFASSFLANVGTPAQPGGFGFATRRNQPIQNTVLRPENAGNKAASPPTSFTASPDDRNMLLEVLPESQTYNGNTTSGGEVDRVNSGLRRQPYVDLQRVMRLSNLVTNQSNVFAVWVTVGLFEYDENTGIGAEYVGPSGAVERTKSFYIIDRSVPVGFAPGKNYNAEKTILLRRKVSR
jgi:hypothetical protein